jgi:MFS family permease
MDRDKLYFISAFFGLLAGNMFNYSVVIFSHSLSTQESFASMVFFTAYLPFAFLSFRAGFVLDKYSRKTVILLSQLITSSSAFIPGLLAFLGLLDSSNKEILFLFAFINGIGMSFIMPGRFAILGDLVDHSKISKSTVFLNIVILVGFALAPIVAGWIRENFSYGTLLMCTGGTYLFSTAVLLFIHVPHEKKHSHPHRKEAFLESWRFVKNEKVVGQALLTMFLGMLLVGPIQVLLPEFGKKVLLLSEAERGTMMGVLGIGLLAGAIASSWIAQHTQRGMFVLLAVLLSGCFFITVGLVPIFAFVIVLLFFGGLFLGTVTSFIPSIIQECTPNQLRGRVMSFYSLIFLLTPALSGLFYGILTHRFNLSETIAIAGLVTVLVSGTSWFFLERFRQYR